MVVLESHRQQEATIKPRKPREGEVVKTMVKFSHDMTHLTRTRSIVDIWNIRAKRKVIKRGWWAKTFRCLGPSDDSCEECIVPESKAEGICKESTDEEDCQCWWTTRKSGNTVINHRRNSNWTRYKFLVHVHCSAPRIATWIKVGELKYGSLHVLWAQWWERIIGQWLV